jgi:hypothetical protein
MQPCRRVPLSHSELYYYCCQEPITEDIGAASNIIVGQSFNGLGTSCLSA